MNTIPAPPCPQWCSPLHHHEDPNGGDIQHISEPLICLHGDERWTASLLHTVECDHIPEPGSVLARLEVTDTAFVGCDCDHLFPVDGIPALVEQLTALYYRARLLGTAALVEPVVTA